jgi:hypothetical protein
MKISELIALSVQLGQNDSKPVAIASSAHALSIARALLHNGSSAGNIGTKRAAIVPHGA